MTHRSSSSGKFWLPAWASILLVLFCLGSHAAPLRTLRFAHLGTEQGLAQETVLTILQDRQGFMWFGTQTGLCRYDGYRMTVYKNDSTDPGSIVDSYVLASFEDAQGRLWFGTRGGLSRYDPKTQRFEHHLPVGSTPKAANRAVTSIVSDGATGLWLATGEGLQHFDPASGKFAAFRNDPQNAESIADDRVKVLTRDAQGDLWIGTATGLERLAAGSTKFKHYRVDAEGMADFKLSGVLALSVSPDGTLWIGTNTGLEAWRLDREAFGEPLQRRRFGKAEGIPARVGMLYHDRDGNLWVGTDTDGLKLRDPASGRFSTYRHELLDKHSLSDNQVSALFQDGTGTLWVGTWYAGANRVDMASGGFERITLHPDDANGLSDNKVKSITGDGRGGLWLGTSGGGLNHLDAITGKVDVMRHDPKKPGSLHDDQVTSLALDPTGRLWVGTRTGLAWLDSSSGRFIRVFLGGDQNTNYIERLMIDRAGDTWIVTRGGLHRIASASGALQSFRNDPQDADSLGDNAGISILEDRHGAIWIGTVTGLDRMDRASGRFTHFRHDANDPASLNHNRVHYLFEDSKGALWVGTAVGLSRVETGSDGKISFRYFGSRNDRSADPIGGILEDSAGNLWSSTTTGLSRLDPATGKFKNYTAKDGLIDGSYFIGSAFRSPDGTMNFGGLAGLTRFKPEAIHDNPHPPPVQITDFLVFNESVRERASPDGFMLDGPIQDTKAVTLSYRDSVFSLEFAALHYADPQRNRYAYQLEGFDQKWVETDASKRYATYTNLDPGHYVFRVKASNKDELWNSAGASIEITITPPFWKTWWFRIIALSLLLSAAYATFRVRIEALVQQKKQLEQQVAARTAELVQQKESVERQKESVEVAHRNISLLSEIGRQITAELDSEAIMLMLYARVNELMDASVFGIGFYRPERELIEYPFAIERGQRYDTYTRSMRDPNQLAVWCLANGKEVFINNLQRDYRDYIEHLDPGDIGTLADGSKPAEPQSLLYVPISVNGRMLGVVSVHSFATEAYTRVHLDMLATLASYVGVALDNADAYRQLKEAQKQLVAQGKLAALGSMVAGIAHELNTPIGNSLMAASTVQEQTKDVARKIEEQSMRRSDLSNYIAQTQHASVLIIRGLNRAADLVSSFKQVAVDHSSAQRRRFNLQQTLHGLIATLRNEIHAAGHSIELDIPADIEMDGYPLALEEVIGKFTQNALLHAFEGRSNGHMLLSASRMPADKVQIQFRDDGVGIAAEHLSRVFDPFFTTKLGRGGSGLGLSIAYNTVTSLLGGQIRVESVPGRGSCFTIELPLTAANPAA